MAIILVGLVLFIDGGWCAFLIWFGKLVLSDDYDNYIDCHEERVNYGEKCNYNT